MQAKEAQLTLKSGYVNYHMLKNSHLGAKIVALSATERQRAQPHTLPHTLFWTLFWSLWVPLGSKPQFDLPITTTWVLPTSYAKIIILALLLIEILRLFGILFCVFYYRYDCIR